MTSTVRTMPAPCKNPEARRFAKLAMAALRDAHALRSIAPTHSCQRGRSLSVGRGRRGSIPRRGSGVLDEVSVAGDADSDLLQRPQGVDDLLDAHPGGCPGSGDGQRGEHDGQVGSIASRVWWKIGYADLPVMPTSGVNVLVRALAVAGRSA